MSWYTDLLPCAAHSKCLMVVATKNKKGEGTGQKRKEKQSEVNYCCLGIRSHLEIWTDILNPEPLPDFWMFYWIKDVNFLSRKFLAEFAWMAGSLIFIPPLWNDVSCWQPCPDVRGWFYYHDLAHLPTGIIFFKSFQSQLHCHIIQELFPDQHLKYLPYPIPSGNLNPIILFSTEDIINSYYVFTHLLSDDPHWHVSC